MTSLLTLIWGKWTHWWSLWRGMQEEVHLVIEATDTTHATKEAVGGLNSTPRKQNLTCLCANCLHPCPSTIVVGACALLKDNLLHPGLVVLALFVLFLCCTACDLAFTTADGCRLSIFLLLWCCGYFCKLKWHFHFYLLLCEDPCHLDNGQLFVCCIVLRCMKKVKLLGWFTYWIVWCRPLLHEGISVRKLRWCPSAASIALSWIQVVDFSWDMTDIWLYATALVTFDVWLYSFLEELDKMRRTSRKSGKLKLCLCCLWKK